ncbi:MAG: hypothetical protein K0R38_1971 [Polyangiaceae bacterium]|nr:hypothetical protein [Polyangiaceae bacterium]
MALAGAGVTVPSYADAPAAEPTHFELRAPEGCSSVEDFSARVRKRSSRILLVPGPAPRSLVVEIQELSPGVLRGSVRVVEPRGGARSRQLKASSCAEAVEALSLIATVTLDPDALLAEPEPQPEPEPEPKPPPPTPAAARPPAPRAPEPAAGAAEARAGYRLSVGLGGALLFNQIPEPAPGGSAAVALELRPGHVLAPFIRLSVIHAQRRNIPEPGGAASFAFTLPTLDVCPVRVGSRDVGVRACAYGSVGLLEVWGSASGESESHSRLSGSGGGALWLGARVSEVFEIVADGRAGALFPRDRFGFDNRGFFTTPRLGFSAGLGVAGGFP